MNNRTRMIFFGTTNQLSLAAFEGLLAGGVAPLAVAVASDSAAGARLAPLEPLIPAPSASELPLLNRFYEPTLIHAAWKAGIPVVALRELSHPVVGRWLADQDVDVACVACFPWRFPPHLMDIPSMGFLNVHPSRLPHYRGPAPLFWLFQRDDRLNRSVTIHLMDDGFDTGPLVVQQPIAFSDGLSQGMIEQACGLLGGQLLLEAITWLADGRPATPQMSPGSYHPWPGPADYRLETSWSARRAFNFMRATNGALHLYGLEISGQQFMLAEALRVDPQAKLATPAVLDGPVAQLQFSPGVLTARMAAV